MMMKSRIWIAEDDRALGSLIQRALIADGHEVILFADGEAAMAAAESGIADLTLLDLGLPRCNGLAVLQAMRAITSTAPVLVLTGDPNLEIRLKCFDLGADDCLLKPFSLRELRARCFALLRRQTGMEAILRFKDLELNRMDHTVRRNGLAIALTNKEYGLLECLMLNKGKCVSRNLLMEQVWKLGAEASTNVVDVYVNYLRRKLLEASDQPLIVTVRGQGYRIGINAPMQG